MILVTGANGIIGSAIVKRLIQNGEKIKILSRKNSDLSTLSTVIDKIEIAYGDILDIPSLELAITNDVDTVIHAAAIVSFGEASIAEMYKVNVEGTQNIVNICLTKKHLKLIYLSSVAALGRPIHALKIDESTQWTESKLNSEYAKTKHFAEMEIWRGIEEGLDTTILCPSVVLGCGNWNNSSAKIFKNIYQGMIFYPTGYTNIVDVNDLSEAVCIVLKNDFSGERFIINGHYLSYKTFFSLIAEGFNKKPPFIKLSKNIGLIGYYLLKITIPFYLKLKFITKETITIASTGIEFDNTKSLQKLKINYTNPKETIQRVTTEILNQNTKK